MGDNLFAEASLSGVEPLMQKIHTEIRKVDSEILAAVRQQVGICLYMFKHPICYFLHFVG